MSNVIDIRPKIIEKKKQQFKDKIYDPFYAENPGAMNLYFKSLSTEDLLLFYEVLSEINEGRKC